MVKNPSIEYLQNSSFKSTTTQNSSRRSKNAIEKMARLKRAYALARSETVTADESPASEAARRTKSTFEMPPADEFVDEFEDEVGKLYAWSKNLNLDEYIRD